MWNIIHGRNEGELVHHCYYHHQETYSGFPSGPGVKNSPVNAGDRVPSLVWEDPTMPQGN